MGLKRKLKRAADSKEERERDHRAASAAIVAQEVFPDPPASPKFVAERVAICLNLVLLCEGKGVQIGKMLDVIRSAAVAYDPKRDGKSDLMRWWGDVKAQREREASTIEVMS